MRAVEILGAEVWDESGARLGRVHDLLLESGAPPVPDSSEPALGIGKLVVGPVGIAHHLGYGRGKMNGPWPLTLLMRWLSARSREIPWSEVVECTSSTITVRSTGSADTLKEDW